MKPTLRKTGKGQSCEAWLDVPLDAAWIAAYRLVIRSGRLDVVEARCVPAGGDLSAVPAGGLTSRKLRELKIAEHLASYPDLHRKVADLLGTKTERKFGAPLTKAQATQPRRPGQGGRDEVFLARLAARYAGMVEDGSRQPIEDLAAELRKKGQDFSTSTVRGFIHDARAKGYLTQTAPGRAGGDVTAMAEELLAANRTPPRMWKGPAKS